MSIATVVTRGYGTSTYSDVNKLPTLGYSQGAAVVTIHGPLLFHAATIYRPGAKAATNYTPGGKAGMIE